MAEDFLSPIDMLLDENNTENIKLYNEENQEVEFEQIALCFKSCSLSKLT